MTASRIRWALIAVIYAAFYFWYGGSGDPISPEDRSTAMATVPVGSFATIRLVPLLILIVIGLLLDRIGARPRSQSSTHQR